MEGNVFFFYFVMQVARSGDSIAIIPTGYRLYERRVVVRFAVGARDFIFYTVSRPTQVFSEYRGSFPASKTART